MAAVVIVLMTRATEGEEPRVYHFERPSGDAVAEATSDCALGEVYDDGAFFDFYGMNPASMVMRFDLPEGTTAIDQVCSCFATLTDSPTSLEYQVVVYDDDGANGSPGTFLGSVAATATSIPVAGESAFYNVSLANSGIVLPDSSVFVGVHFNSSTHLFCGDRSSETALRPVYQSRDGSSWDDSQTEFWGDGPRVWGIRVDKAASRLACMTSAEELCLNGGRFKVSATFDTTSSTGIAQAVQLTDETGYFWFFSSSNVEAVVKIIDGCGYNDSYWFFAGGLTNVRTELTVTDTATGAIRTYSNPLGTAFESIQDTSAFSSCP